MTALPRGRTKSETRKSEDNDFDASGRKARPPPEKDSPEKNSPSKSKTKKKKGDQKKRRSREQQQQRHAVLVVLGDFGHSPRAQNHALSLVKRGHVVTVIAYANGSSGKKGLEKAQREKNGRFRVVGISRWPVNISRIPLVPSIVYFAFRVVLQFVQVLLCLLFETGRVKVTDVMVQNPPCLPTLLACAVAKRCMNRNVKFTIDWHNLGFSIFSMQRKRGEKDVLVKIMKAHEKYFSRYFDHHLTVTEKMKQFLVDEWRVDAERISVVKDAPGEQFLRLNSIATREKKVGFRKKTNDVVNVISSTSWTPDEDFDVLLDAVALYDKRAKASARTKKTKRLPHLNILITGKGDLRQSFETRAKEANLKCVSFSYAWLPIHEYPQRLAMSDVGLCLHQSSSKLDLPMKIVDMFGVGIPVVARGYECLREELVREGVNGVLFDTSEELCDVLTSLLEGWDGKENGTDALNQLEVAVTRDRLSGIFSPSSTTIGRRKAAVRPLPPPKKGQLEDSYTTRLAKIEDEEVVDLWEENWVRGTGSIF